MKAPTDLPLFWDRRGPIASLSGAVLLIGATSRFSHALIVSASILFVYSLAPFTLRAFSRFVPNSQRVWIQVVFITTIAAVFDRIVGIAWPLLVRELALYLGMVPLCLIASGLSDRFENESPLRTLKASVTEALILCGLTLAFALIREPFGYGTLSVPGADGIQTLISAERAAALSLRSLSASTGALILLGYILAIYRKIRFHQNGFPQCGEDEA